MSGPRERDEMGRFLPAVRGVERPSEVRDPSAATQQVRWLGRGMPQVPEWNAQTAISKGQQTQSYVYRAVEAPAEAIAGLPFLAGRTCPQRPGDQAPSDPANLLARLLGPPPGGPNRHWSGRELVRWTIISYLITGRGAWEIEYQGKVGASPIRALWPLPTTELRAIPANGGDKYFEAFEYGPTHDPTRLRPEQVFYWWRPSQHDVTEPESVLRAAGLPASVLIAAEQYLYSFLRNGAVPAAVITTETFPDDEVRRAFRGQWQDRFQGPENAGRVAFNEVGDGEGSVADAISVDVVGASNKDSQLLELHDAARDQVLEAFGTPRSVVGDASGSTFANADAEWRNWWVSKLAPLALNLGDAINMQLAPRLGPSVGWFDLSGIDVFQKHQILDAQGVALLVGAGVITPDEGRAPFGLPPIEGGGALVLPVPEPVVPEAEPTEEEPDDEPLEPPRARPAVDDDRRGRGGDADRRAAVAERENRATARADKRRLIWAATDARLGGMERQWERGFKRLFSRQQKAVLARLTGPRRSKRWVAASEARAYDGGIRAGLADLFDPAEWTVETRGMAADLYEVVVSASLSSITGTTGLSFDLEAPWVTDFIGARSNQLAGQVTGTTYRQLQEALSEGVQAGEGIDDLARRVRHVFDVATSRAATIARTEVISAYNGAAVAGASGLPAEVVGGQEWIATGDGRTRADHSAADGQTVAVGQPFSVGGSSMAYPGDPAGGADQTVNCRCTVGFLTPDEMAATILPPPRLTLASARAALRLVEPTTFDPDRFRSALQEMAA